LNRGDATPFDTYFLETYGCTLNTSDSELIVNILDGMLLLRVDAVENAAFIVINTCGVKAPTEKKIFHQIEQFGKLQDKILIITGCLPLIYKANLDAITHLVPGFGALIGPKNYHELEAIMHELLSGRINMIKLDGKSLEEKTALEPRRSHDHLGIIAIAEGCLGACNYCCTRFARGPLMSYPAPTLAGKFNALIDDGVKEIWITAEDCSAYIDKENSVDLPGLLDAFLQQDGKYFIRLGMMNPKTLLPVHEKLIHAFQDDRVFKFIHVPVQSGSDRVLDDMNRRYTVADFNRMINNFKIAFPAITIATDVICGYPGETDDDFEATLDLMRAIKPDVINISMYGHRPGTVASKRKQLPTDIVKERSRKLTTLHKEITGQNNEEWIGWEGPAIIDEFNAENNNWVARIPVYKPVIVDHGTLGEFVRVRILSSTSYYFIGEVLD
jgi:threonylcarbamoyladenosine tRNA methylthiotransferase CDKAL1